VADTSTTPGQAEAGGAWPAGLLERCRAVQLLALDVDGVLTDGRITYTPDGVEIKSFHVRDGSALVHWQKLGKRVAIISGRTSKAVDVRAAELGITQVRQGAADKRFALRTILAATGIKPEQVCAVGDDLPELPLLQACGLAVAVADACAEVRSAAHYVTRTPGGYGAVREVIELILRAQGRWDALVESLRG
jgi:3-deoxy-D-manno-octulosonate 8-phosphate phosphatase (KDO 8-P phosphatase)